MVSDDLTARAERCRAELRARADAEWASVAAQQCYQAADRVLGDLLAEVAWLDAFNRSEQFQNGPTKRAEASEASLAAIRGLVTKWHNYSKAVEQEQTPGFYWGLRHCADELAALFPTNDTPKEPA